MNILSYDVGTTGVKTCLYQISDRIKLIDTSFANYPILIASDGSAEQDPNDWWEAICKSTKEIADKNSVIDAISFCSQQQSLVLVDRKGNFLRNSMNYMDQRAQKQKARYLEKGLQVAGVEVKTLLQSVYHTGAIAASVKDPVWKYHWVKENEPEIYGKIYKWLDVKEALIYKMTDEAIMSEDSAFATLLYDIRSKDMIFSKSIMKLLDVDPDHLPRIIASTDIAGKLTARAAKQLGLKEGIDVYAGGGDSALTPIGAGMFRPKDTHIYMGTSGWASSVTDKRYIDTQAMIASIVGAIPGLYNYFAELETAGKCLEWVRDHLVLDEINVYLDQKDVTMSKEKIYRSLYDYLSEVIDTANPGSDGVIFTPWLHGNRCPFEDPNARAMFFNISLETGKTELLRAVIEGVCFHFRWFLETMEKKIETSEKIRFVGGGALSSVTCQILSDILGRPVVPVEDPQNVGAVGAALIAYLGKNPEADMATILDRIPLGKTYYPKDDNKAVYEKNYQVFKKLHGANKKFFAQLQGEL